MVNDDIPQDPAGDEPDRTAPARAAGDVTLILSRIEQGEPQAAEQLLPLVYDELRKLAAAKMAQEKPGQTLQATALVHEAYIRLVDVEQAQHWDSRGHFYSAAAEAMRRILVNRARDKGRLKHGGDKIRLDLNELDIAVNDLNENVLILDETLERLAWEAQTANLLKLRFFAGLSMEQAAQALGLSQSTAYRCWAFGGPGFISNWGRTQIQATSEFLEKLSKNVAPFVARWGIVIRGTTSGSHPGGPMPVRDMQATSSFWGSDIHVLAKRRADRFAQMFFSGSQRRDHHASYEIALQNGGGFHPC